MTQYTFDQLNSDGNMFYFLDSDAVSRTCVANIAIGLGIGHKFDAKGGVAPDSVMPRSGDTLSVHSMVGENVWIFTFIAIAVIDKMYADGGERYFSELELTNWMDNDE